MSATLLSLLGFLSWTLALLLPSVSPAAVTLRFTAFVQLGIAVYWAFRLHPAT